MIEKILERARAELFNLTFHKSERCKGFNDGIHTVIKIIQEESKNGGWIPCSERLPEKEGWYIVTCEDKEIWKTPIVRELFYYPTLKSFIDNIRYSEHGCNDVMKYDWTKYVTAWKPEDTPYQKGE